jgi:hypothetical protein
VPDAFDMLAAIRDSRDEIQDALDPEELAAFTRRRDEFGARARTSEGPDGMEELAAEVRALIDDYPAVRLVLQRHAPDLMEPSVGSGRREPAAAAKGPPDDRDDTSSRHTTVADSPPTPETATPIQGEVQSTTNERSRARSGAPGSAWTPEVKLQALREAIAGAIGVVILGVTVYLAVLTFQRAGDQAKLTDSKDILQLMLGLAGVVLGYYFGRIPGDARAAQAQDQAISASEHAARVAAKGEELATRVDQAVATRGAASDEDAAAIQQLRAELRALTQAR